MYERKQTQWNIMLVSNIKAHYFPEGQYVWDGPNELKLLQSNVTVSISSPNDLKHFETL